MGQHVALRHILAIKGIDLSTLALKTRRLWLRLNQKTKGGICGLALLPVPVTAHLKAVLPAAVDGPGAGCAVSPGL